MPVAYSDVLTMFLPQQHVGLCWPPQVGGADLVTVSSHPQFASGQRYTSPPRNGMSAAFRRVPSVHRDARTRPPGQGQEWE